MVYQKFNKTECRRSLPLFGVNDPQMNFFLAVAVVTDVLLSKI